MKSAVKGRSYAHLLIAVAVASAGIALLLYAIGLFHDTERSSVDTRFSIRGDETPRDDVVLVLIDDTTSRELPVRFPFPRSLHARVIDEISREGPKAIAYDVEFLQPTKPKEDSALINAVARAGPDKVVLADSQPDPQGQSGVFGGQKILVWAEGDTNGIGVLTIKGTGLFFLCPFHVPHSHRIIGTS